jgi:hypothetical protein
VLKNTGNSGSAGCWGGVKPRVPLKDGPAEANLRAQNSKRKNQHCVLRNTGSVEERGKFRRCWTPESCEAASPAEDWPGWCKSEKENSKTNTMWYETENEVLKNTGNSKLLLRYKSGVKKSKM